MNRIPENIMKEWQKIKKENYDDPYLTQTEFGIIEFSRKSMKEVRNIGNLSYDKYLDAQCDWNGTVRHWFQTCYYEGGGYDFKGRIEKKTKDKICFEKIYVSGLYYNSGGDCFEGKEEHVWMSSKGFEDFQVQDCVFFTADVYRYLKKSHGLVIDFGLENPFIFDKIEEYQLPSDKDIHDQTVDQMVCEVCWLADKCDHIYCMNENGRKMLMDAFDEICSKDINTEREVVR